MGGGGRVNTVQMWFQMLLTITVKVQRVERFLVEDDQHIPSHKCPEGVLGFDQLLSLPHKVRFSFGLFLPFHGTRQFFKTLCTSPKNQALFKNITLNAFLFQSTLSAQFCESPYFLKVSKVSLFSGSVR